MGDTIAYDVDALGMRVYRLWAKPQVMIDVYRFGVREALGDEVYHSRIPRPRVMCDVYHSGPSVTQNDERCLPPVGQTDRG